MFKPDKIKINKNIKETTINILGVFIDKNDWDVDNENSNKMLDKEEKTLDNEILESKSTGFDKNVNDVRKSKKKMKNAAHSLLTTDYKNKKDSQRDSMMNMLD